jgi:hypothetical protein
MPFLKNDTDLAGTVGYFASWRWAKKPPNQRFTMPRKGYGFVVSGQDMRVRTTQRNDNPFPDSFVNSNAGIVIRAGMQGLLLQIRGVVAQVRFINLSWEGQPMVLILPITMLIGGDVPYNNKWTLNYTIEPTNYRSPPAAVKDAADSGVLGHTIATLLKLTQDSGFSWLPKDLATTFGPRGEHIQAITDIIVAGTRRAGVFSDVLNKPGFKMRDINRWSKKITKQNMSTDWARQQVIYYIWYEMENGETYLYVGKTRAVSVRLASYDVAERTVTPKLGTHTYIRKNALRRTMGVLCHFSEKNEYLNISHVAEQVFVNLLQTYRPSMIALSNKITMRYVMSEEVRDSSEDPTPDKQVTLKNRYVADAMHCKALREIARKTFELTGWEGGVARDEFGAAHGVNWNSPLIEHWREFWPVLFLRIDAWCIEPSTGDTFLVANLHRSKEKFAQWYKKQRKPGGAYHICMGVWNAPQGPSTKSGAIHHTYQVGFQINNTDNIAGIDDTEWPSHLSKVHLTFEVRLDWRSHQHGWSRVPDIGPYRDWNAANCWAMKLSWLDKEGNPRHRYHQYFYTQSRADGAFEDEPGALQGYAQGTAILHWMFGETHHPQRRWIYNYPGKMSVQKQTYNCLDWSIKFVDPGLRATYSPPPPNGTLKEEEDIVREMQNLGGHSEC